MTAWGDYPPGPWLTPDNGDDIEVEPWLIAVGFPSTVTGEGTSEVTDEQVAAACRLISKAYLIPRLEAALLRVHGFDPESADVCASGICTLLAETAERVVTDWTSRIACADVDGDIFYPTGTSREYANWAPARAVCASCPVIRECRDATDRIEAERPVSEVIGMFAGETPKERKARRKRSHAWADRALPPVERDLAMMRRAILRGELGLVDEHVRDAV